MKDTSPPKELIAAIAQVNRDMLRWSWQELGYRLDILCATDGEH